MASAVSSATTYYNFGFVSRETDIEDKKDKKFSFFKCQKIMSRIMCLWKCDGTISVIGGFFCDVRFECTITKLRVMAPSSGEFCFPFPLSSSLYFCLQNINI